MLIPFDVLAFVGFLQPTRRTFNKIGSSDRGCASS